MPEKSVPLCLSFPSENNDWNHFCLWFQHKTEDTFEIGSLIYFALQKHMTYDWLTQCSMETIVPVFQAVIQFCSQGSLDSFCLLYYVVITLFLGFLI